MSLIPVLRRQRLEIITSSRRVWYIWLALRQPELHSKVLSQHLWGKWWEEKHPWQWAKRPLGLGVVLISVRSRVYSILCSCQPGAWLGGQRWFMPRTRKNLHLIKSRQCNAGGGRQTETCAPEICPPTHSTGEWRHLLATMPCISDSKCQDRGCHPGSYQSCS